MSAEHIEEDYRVKALREIERRLKRYDAMREALSCALDEHDGEHGQFKPDFMPNHWTHKARQLLKD